MLLGQSSRKCSGAPEALILETLPNFDGLERLMVFAVGLDAAGQGSERDPRLIARGGAYSVGRGGDNSEQRERECKQDAAEREEAATATAGLATADCEETQGQGQG